jgi:hypothetical protein
MAVALMAHPEFFRTHMKALIGIAPVISLKNIDSSLLKTLAKSQNLVNWLESMCPTILETPGAFN